jgi:hypothetical protein
MIKNQSFPCEAINMGRSGILATIERQIIAGAVIGHNNQNVGTGRPILPMNRQT